MSSADSYDELGRLRTKKRHGGADTETYAYNIRNWTTQINSGSFTEKLYYNTNPLNARPCYNGNISYSTWTYNNGSTTAEKGYAYEYDELNRLVNAEYQQGSSSQTTGSFNEQFTYDKMGNILTLQRKKDNALIDNLTYNYKNNNGSNQLNYITDAAGTRGLSTIKEYQGLSAATAEEFQYDANGNLIKDADREIVRIKYNLLNLPDTVVFANGNLIINRYDAGGRKLLSRYLTKVEEALLPVLIPKKTLEKPSRFIGEDFETIDEDLDVPDKIITLDIKTFEGYETNYAENVEYESTVDIYTDRTETTTQTLTRLHTPEGYITTVSSSQYHYYRRDHLGNNREVWLANTNTTLQRTQYYPSGLPWAEGLGAGVQNKKYNGKEFVEMHGWDTYDYGARGYYPAIGRFTTIDPLAEDYYDLSPYNYCAGNPITCRDENGEWINFVIGAAVGAITDYAVQVATNVASGQDIGEAMTNVSGTSIALAAGAGAMGVGIASGFSKLATVGKLATVASKSKTAANVVKVAANVAGDATASVAGSVVQGKEVTVKGVVADVVGGAVAKKIETNVKTSAQNSPTGKTLQKQADRAQRVARGSNPRQSRVNNAKAATTKANNYGATKAFAAGTAGGNAVSKGYEIYEKIKKKK